MENFPNAEIYADIKVLEDNEFDFKERRIYLIGEITSEEIIPTVTQLHFLTSKERFPETYKDPVKLILSSDGGYDDMMMILYDIITTCEAPVVTVGTGHVASAATLILACGDTRHVTENCMVMTHKGKVTIEGDEDEVAAQQEMMAKMSHKYWHLLARHTNKTATEWRAKSKEKGEHWISGEELIEWGVVDSIIKPARRLRKIPKMSKKALERVVHRFEESEDDDVLDDEE